MATKTVHISPKSDCDQPELQGDSSAVRLRLLNDGEKVVLSTDVTQVVKCITQQIEDLPPSHQNQVSLEVYFRPRTFPLGVTPSGSNTGSATINSNGNFVAFTPPIVDDVDQWDIHVYREEGGTTTQVNLVKVELTQI